MSIEMNNNIPEDVMFDMLRKLPAKSLVRFKGVCKSWCSFINALSNSSSDNNQTQLIFSTLYDIHSVNVLLPEEATETTKALNFPFSGVFHMLIGSCNGLLCILVQKKRQVGGEADLVLWNPWTGRYEMVSISQVNLYQEVFRPHCRNTAFGFGYDQSTNDYKIVRLLTFVARTQFQIYSFNTNSWKIGTLPWTLPYAPKHSGTFINGALYWRIDCFDVPDQRVILHFNLVNDKFCLILPPVDDDEFDLCDFGGCLCVVHYPDDIKTAHIDIWIMKEQNNWVKSTAAIPRMEGLDIRSYLAPVFFYKTGEVLMHMEDIHFSRGNGLLYLYSPEEKIFKKYKNDSMEKFISYKEIAYSPTLVSLPHHRQQASKEIIAYSSQSSRTEDHQGTQANNEIEKKEQDDDDILLRFIIPNIFNVGWS